MANHEYLVYKSDNTNLDEKEAAAVYAVLCILPYPMNTNPLHASYIAKLTKRQRALLDSSEDIVVLEKLREINPKISILKFPKSMYQFYISMLFEEITLSQHHANLKKNFGKFAKLMEAQLENLIALLDIETEKYLPNYRQEKDRVRGNFYEGDFKDKVDHREDRKETQRYVSEWFFLSDWITWIHHDFDEELYYQRCHSANTFPFKTQFWAAINEALLAECQYVNHEQYFERLHAFAGIWCDLQKKCIVDDINYALQNSSLVPPEDINELPYVLQLVNEFTPLLQKIFQFEIACINSAKLNNLYIIYRGSYLGPNGDYSESTKDKYHTLSFGDGLFAGGSPADPGAVAWNFISRYNLWCLRSQAFEHYFSPNTGYALLLTKQQATKMFEVPPLTNLSKVFGSGEYFHVRSKPTNLRTDVPRYAKPENICPDVPKYILNNYIMISDKRRERVQNYMPCTARLLMENELSSRYAVADTYNNPDRYSIVPFLAKPQKKSFKS
jgi:hypothetical protein